MHRAGPPRRRLPWISAIAFTIGILGIATALSIRAGTTPVVTPPARTRTVTQTVSVPGPTVTISYLVVVTATPGRDGF